MRLLIVKVRITEEKNLKYYWELRDEKKFLIWCCKEPSDRKQRLFKLHFERDPTKDPTSLLELLITFLGGFMFCKVWSHKPVLKFFVQISDVWFKYRQQPIPPAHLETLTYPACNSALLKTPSCSWECCLNITFPPNLSPFPLTQGNKQMMYCIFKSVLYVCPIFFPAYSYSFPLAFPTAAPLLRPLAECN